MRVATNRTVLRSPRLLINAGIAAAVTLWSTAALAAPQTHDGFQFRGGIGAGYLSLGVKADGVPDSNIHGASGSLALYFGGTVGRGLVMGGFTSVAAVAGPKLSVNGKDVGSASSDVSLNFFMIGPYVNWYPDPTTGFHLLGELAFAAANVSDGNGNKSATPTGGAIGFGVGYDWWVSDEWSLGVLGRLNVASLKYEDSASACVGGTCASASYKETDTVVSPAVLFSFEYQ
jgi:hypothetical protein